MCQLLDAVAGVLAERTDLTLACKRVSQLLDGVAGILAERTDLTVARKTASQLLGGVAGILAEWEGQMLACQAAFQHLEVCGSLAGFEFSSEQEPLVARKEILVHIVSAECNLDHLPVRQLVLHQVVSVVYCYCMIEHDLAGEALVERTRILVVGHRRYRCPGPARC